MSNAEDDERSLLEATRASLDNNQLEYHMSDHIYPYTSFILKNVTALRLDSCKMGVPSIPDEGVSEKTIEELNFKTNDFKDIGNILKEIERASSAEMVEHKFALSLQRILAGRQGYNYNNIFILVGTLAAFAVTHGVWLLVLKFVCANSIEEDIVMVLKRVEGLFITLRRNQGKGENDFHLDFYIYISLLASSITRIPEDNWKSMDSLYSLINAMFEVVSVSHLFINNNALEFIPIFLADEFDNLVHLSIYWVIRGVVACSSQCKELPKNRFVVQDSLKLTDICQKLVSIHERLQKLDSAAKQYTDYEKITNAYQIPYKKGQDTYFALMGLFGLQPDGSEDVKPFHCSKKNTDLSMVSLRHKTVVLLISGLDISSNVISFLKDIYVEYMTSLYEAYCEFIWLPIHSGPWITSSEEQYTRLLQMMPWYTVHHPTFLTEETKRFIRDVWMFHRKSIAVVLNENGNVVCPNAMHMMYIWGAEAFPFTRMRERSLWAKTRLSSIVLDFDTNIYSMLEASKWIILFGGIDDEWIKKFITCVREISVDSGTSFEMIYVGKNAASENIREVISSTCVDMPQIYSPDSKNIWYFWTQLESLLICRYQLFGEVQHHTKDPIIREVKDLLSYASAESWACLISPSSDMIIHDLGDTMLQGFMEFKLWKQHLHSKDFSKIFLNHIEQLRQSQVSYRSCSRIVLNIDNKDVVQSLECPHCNDFLEKKVQYKCCHTDDEL